MPSVGLLQGRSKAGNAAQRMDQEVIKYEGLSKKVCMDSKADAQALYVGLSRPSVFLSLFVPKSASHRIPAADPR